MSLCPSCVRIQPDLDKSFFNSIAQKSMGLEVAPWNRLDEERVVIVVGPERTAGMG